MFSKIIVNDILKNKIMTVIIVVFIITAAMLVSLAAILVINLSGSIDGLMNRAVTPHFMQMHSGSLNRDQIETFAHNNEYVDDFQVLEFLNIEGSQILMKGKSLVGSIQDNGLTTQSDRFDFLLDLDGQIINVKDGEIYIPVAYMKDHLVNIGDQVVICGRTFITAGFLRDSQMNSSLASSKRFLVSKKDYEALFVHGIVEYLIEFRLKDPSMISKFEKEYTRTGLAANGPTITFPLFKFLNVLSDGLMISVILLVSVLIVAIALVCIRFSLLTKIEDEYLEIGVMKALGIQSWKIRMIYLVKYMAVATLGCLLGYALSLLFKDMLLENIRLYMGTYAPPLSDDLFGIVGVLVVFFSINLHVNRILNRFRKISPSEAIRFGTSPGNAKGIKIFHLVNNSFINSNFFLGIKDVITRKHLYFTMLLVLIISVFIINVPQTLYHTVSSREFTRYMGIGNYDIRIDIQQIDGIVAKAGELENVISHDRDISKYAVFLTRSYHIKMENGSEQNIKIETGDHSLFPVEYSHGRVPYEKEDIALSSINAADLDKKVGDTLAVIVGGKTISLRVCGIYSDITNGGKTAKAVFQDLEAPIMWCVICVEIPEKSQINGEVSEYAKKFNYIKISRLDEYIQQTFGSTLTAIGKASTCSVIIALVITILITILFLKMLILRDRHEIAIMKALGFTNSDIRVQYIARAVVVLIVGVILGTLLVPTLGEWLAGLFISQLGASSFRFTIDPLKTYLLNPFLMLFFVFVATLLGTIDVGKLKIADNIKED